MLTSDLLPEPEPPVTAAIITQLSIDDAWGLLADIIYLLRSGKPKIERGRGRAPKGHREFLVHTEPAPQL